MIHLGHENTAMPGSDQVGKRHCGERALRNANSLNVAAYSELGVNRQSSNAKFRIK